MQKYLEKANLGALLDWNFFIFLPNCVRINERKSSRMVMTSNLDHKKYTQVKRVQSLTMVKK